VTEHVFRPIGDLDLCTVDQVFSDWLEIIDREQPQHVTVDLSRLEFVDTCGLRMLSLLRHSLLSRGATCDLRGASLHQQKLLRIAGLSQLFPNAGQPLRDQRTPREEGTVEDLETQLSLERVVSLRA
jgi:anti-anti-sigma factor